jgi:hypothetical protein
LIAFVLATCFSAAHAQVTARIKGTVADPTGAIVPGATVVATNQATGVKTTTTSQKDGGYLFPNLTPGTYSISVAVTGFKAFSASGIVITIDQEYVEPVTLATGAASDTVSVEADSVQVNTTDMQLSNIVDSAQMEELPLIGRNFTGLELTLPGVQASSDRFGTFSVSGAQTQQSEFLINGADTNDIALNTLAIAPNLDAIDQFNLIEGPLNAEYDRNSGGIVTASIKQGTNHFHGDAFEFYRDTFLNTPGYFSYNSTTKQKTNSTFHQNIYGGTIGGPILRDKLFFFGAYQGIYQIVPGSDGTGANNVLSTANRTGNFSENAGTGARPVANATQCGGGPGAPDWGNFAGCTTVPSTINIPNCTAGEYWSQCAFDHGGDFSGANLSPIATKLVSTYVPTASNGTYGYNFNSTVGTKSNQYIGRIDYSLNPRNQFTALGIYFKSTVASTIPFTGASLPGFGENDIEHIQQYTFDYVRQISASAVNDFALHWTRFNYQAVNPQNVVLPSSLGFDIVPQDIAAASVPTIAVSGNFTNFTLGFSTNGPQPRIDQVYQIDETFSKSLGHHQLKFGYDGRRFNVSNPFNASNSGDFGFGSSQGSAGANSPYSTGDGALDFLLGIPGGYSQGSGATIQADAFLNYMYAQDAWKLTNTFTLNYGLGYSIDTPLHNNQYGGEAISCLIPGEQSAIFPAAPLGIVYPGDPGCNNAGQATTRYTEFGPRIGFAWAPDLGIISGSPGKFSIRGGFGIYYNRTEEETALQTLQTPPFGTSTSGAADFGGVPSFANPFADVNGGGKEANKFPYTFPTKGQAINPASYNPVYYFSTYGPSFRAPYSENFQLSVERELPSKTIARVSYVGSLGRRNQITYEGNPETAAGHAACLAGNEMSPVTGSLVNCVVNRNVQNLYFPQNTAYGAIYAPTGYPGFTNAGVVGSEAASSYHALQVSVTKAASHGLMYQLSYTYSHALDNGSSFENSGFGEAGSRGYNQYNPSLNYGDSNFDARQRLVFSPIYITPRLAGEWYSVKNLAASGWEISGIVTLATGFPYDISYAGGTSRSLYCDFTGYYACPDVPVQTAALTRLNPRNFTTGKGGWFASTGFAAEPIGSFGNIHRDPYHGPGLNNTNMILAKNFPLGADSVRRLQLRMESDNVFNHTQFSNPTSTYGSGTFGRITGTQQAARQTQLAVKIYF